MNAKQLTFLGTPPQTTQPAGTIFPAPDSTPLPYLTADEWRDDGYAIIGDPEAWVCSEDGWTPLHTSKTVEQINQGTHTSAGYTPIPSTIIHLPSLHDQLNTINAQLDTINATINKWEQHQTRALKYKHMADTPAEIDYHNQMLALSVGQKIQAIQERAELAKQKHKLSNDIKLASIKRVIAKQKEA